LQDDAVGARWGAETLDLTLERLELVPGVPEQLGETEVPGAQGVDLDGLPAVCPGLLVGGSAQVGKFGPLQRHLVPIASNAGTPLRHRQHLPLRVPTASSPPVSPA